MIMIDAEIGSMAFFSHIFTHNKYKKHSGDKQSTFNLEYE